MLYNFWWIPYEWYALLLWYGLIMILKLCKYIHVVWNSLPWNRLLRTMLSMKSLIYDVVDYGLYSYDQVSHVCQFPSIESWGYLYPKNIAMYIKPCHVITIISVKPWSIELNRACDSGNLRNLMISVDSQIVALIHQSTKVSYSVHVPSVKSRSVSSNGSGS